MERTIDRTSYRRSARQREKATSRMTNEWMEPEEEIVENGEDKHFSLVNMILNQTIVSLILLLGILTAQYYDKEEVIQWISQNLSGGYCISELVQKIKMETIVESGEAFASGDDVSIIQDDMVMSGEEVPQLISAVEGINQMADDVQAICQQYSMVSPITGTITSHFGVRIRDNASTSSYHTGLDIATENGTVIHSATNGIVTLAQSYGSYGNCVIITQGELVTLYAHCSSLLVKEGEKVQQGDAIATVGMTGNATGPHLHFEIRYQDRWIDPELVLYKDVL